MKLANTHVVVIIVALLASVTTCVATGALPGVVLATAATTLIAWLVKSPLEPRTNITNNITSIAPPALDPDETQPEIRQ